MQIQLSPAEHARLAAVAARSGRTPEQFATELLEAALRPVDPAFRAAVQEGLAQARRGEFIDEEEMERRIQEMLK